MPGKPKYKFPFMGGTVYAVVERTGPRTVHVEGRLVYGKGTVSIPFRADIEAGLLVKDDTGMLTQGADVVTRIVELMRTAAEQAAAPAPRKGRP